jgi:ribosome assembly protein YihI (activator of Der GTPase)
MCPNRTDRRQVLLDRLERRLARQLELAAVNDFEGLEEMLTECDRVLGELLAAGGASCQDAERIARIRQLHNTLGLSLTQKRDELAAQLHRRRHGLKTLHAYRRAMP